MVWCYAAVFRATEHQIELIAHLGLANEFLDAFWAQGTFNIALTVLLRGFYGITLLRRAGLIR
ncbi:hypothetical protein GCM10007338_02010 [Corynebacterium pelargi]|nr:hypothetical protein GCM10007338_02010 [Corynebacterium pelargi]